MADQRPPHSFAERFVRGNLLSRFWNLLGGLVGLGTSFITLTALSVHQFGLYQLALSALVLGQTFSVNLFDDVIKNDISRELSGGRREAAKRLLCDISFLKIGLGIVVALAVFFLADFVAARYDKDIGGYIRIISFLTAIRAAQSSASLLLGAVVSLRAMGASAVEEAVKLLLVSGFFLFSFLSIERLLISMLIGASAALLYVGIAFLKEYNRFFSDVSSSKEFQLKKILKAYGGWILIRSAIKRGAKPVHPWLVATLLNAEAVALYALSANLVTMVKNFFPNISASLLAWEVNNAERLRFIFGRGIKYSFLYGLVLASLAFVLIPPAVGIFFPKYLPAMPLLMILLISVPFHGIQKLEMEILTALREQKILAARLFLEISLSFGILIVLAPFIGVYAAAIGAVVPIVWRVWYLYRQIVKKYPELKPGLRSVLRFDRDDRFIAGRALGEVKSFLAAYAPVQWLGRTKLNTTEKKM